MFRDKRHGTLSTGHPSWLALEQLALASEGALVDSALAENEHETHLAQCESCLSRMRFIQQDTAQRTLRPLPPRNRTATQPARTAQQARTSVMRLWWWLAPAAIATMVALTAVEPATDAPHPVIARYTSRVGVKGGALAMTLVRERQGTLHRHPRHFAEGDRFKVELSSPGNMPRYYRLIVFQGNAMFFPLGREGMLTGGNAETLPGAFMLNGSGPATVCVATATRRAALQNRPLNAGSLPPESVCLTLHDS